LSIELTPEEVLQSNVTPFTLFMAKKNAWREVIEWYDCYLNALAVGDDLDHNDIKRLDAAIHRLYCIFRKDYARVLERREKIDRAIKRVTAKAAALSDAGNDKARKAAGIMAAENYQLDANHPNVNLYELEDEYSAYYQFFSYVNDTMEHKTWVLGRALGANKIEGFLSR
jgi:hypothetical protein